VSFDSVDADSPNRMEYQTYWFYLKTSETNHYSFDIFFLLELRSSDSSISQMYMQWSPPAFRLEKEPQFQNQGNSLAETILFEWALYRSNGSATNAHMLL